MHTLKNKLIAFNVLLMALFGTVVVLLALVQVRANLLEQIDREFEQVLSAQALMTELWMGEKTRQINTLADTALDSEAKRFLKSGAKSGGFYVAYTGFADGRSLFSDDWEAPADYIVPERDWYKSAVAAGHPVFTAPYIDVESKELMVTVAAPFSSSGKVEGVVAGDIFIKDLVKTVLSQSIRGNGYFFMVDRKGILIAHPQPGLTLKPLSSVASELTADRLSELIRDGGVSDVRIANNAMLMSLKPVPGSDWLIGVVADKQEILAPLDKLIYSVLGLTLLVFIVAIPISGFVLQRMLRGLFLLKSAMIDIAKGDADLTLRLPTSGKDEITETARAFNVFVEQLNRLFLELKSDANKVIHGVQEANGLVRHVADSSQKMSVVSAANAAALTQMTQSISQIAENAGGANARVSDTSEQLVVSSGKISELSTGMESTAQAIRGLESMLNSLTKRSEDIRGITGVIREIADQTNLLALNAAIEAARAGEGGRGFAVVADEVRKLAERTAQATMKIAEMVNAIHQETGQASVDVNKTVAAADIGVSLTHEMAENIHNIRAVMTDVVSRMNEIVQSTNEQHSATEKIVSNSDSLYGDVQSTLEKTCTALEQLAGSVSQMESEFGRFKL